MSMTESDILGGFFSEVPCASREGGETKKNQKKTTTKNKPKTP